MFPASRRSRTNKSHGPSSPQNRCVTRHTTRTAVTSEMGETVISITLCPHGSEANGGSVSKVAKHFQVALSAFLPVLPKHKPQPNCNYAKLDQDRHSWLLGPAFSMTWIPPCHRFSLTGSQIAYVVTHIFSLTVAGCGGWFRLRGQHGSSCLDGREGG